MSLKSLINYLTKEKINRNIYHNNLIEIYNYFIFDTLSISYIKEYDYEIDNNLIIINNNNENNYYIKQALIINNNFKRLFMKIIEEIYERRNEENIRDYILYLKNIELYFHHKDNKIVNYFNLYDLYVKYQNLLN